MVLLWCVGIIFLIFFSVNAICSRKIGSKVTFKFQLIIKHKPVEEHSQ